MTEQIESTSFSGRFGMVIKRHHGAITAAQCCIVLSYLILVVLPAFLPLPPSKAHVWNDLSRFANSMLWGIWWPCVILSIMVLGRMWCGILCPEGALTEWVSRYGLGLGIPRWIKWGGWPFIVFVMTTLFGQATSVYEYPKPTLLILGSSTIAAIIVGLIWGREKRVWCRYLCPVSGVFGLLAKIAPLHFNVDQSAWDGAPAGHRTSRQHIVNCAPLINIRRMKSASACHMCGRCAGERNAVQLALRSTSGEILAEDSALKNTADEQSSWHARLLIFGMLGISLGAFQWRSSPWFAAGKLAAEGLLINHEVWWPLHGTGHWWLLTYYPEANDVFTWLDGGMLLAYIGAEAFIIGGWVWAWLRLAGAVTGSPWQRLSQTLIPFAGINVFVGLSLLSTSRLAREGVTLPWAHNARIVLLALGALWGASLAWRLAKHSRAVAALAIAMATALPLAAWSMQFFVW